MTDQTETLDNEEGGLRRFFFRGEDIGVLDPARVRMSEATMLKAVTKMTLRALGDGLEKMDGEAWKALVWFLLFRKGNQVDYRSLDFEFGDVISKPEPNPTKAPSGTDDASTSEPSLNSSDSAPTS